MSRARDIANYGDGIDTSSITSGTFADARIAQSNVTQHESAIDALASNPTITLGSNATFPTGHVIRHFYDEYDFAGSIVTIAGDTFWSGLEIEITNPSTSNYILVTTFIPSVYNANATGHGLNVGFAYSTDNFSTPTTLGVQDQYDAQAPWVQNAIVAQSYTARFAHPTASNYKIRMRLNKYTSGNINIGQAGSGTQSVATMSAFEIQG